MDKRLTEHLSEDPEHDQSDHGTRYDGGGPVGQRTSAGRSIAFARQLGDQIDDLGEYIHITMPNDEVVSLTNWEEVEKFERKRLQQHGGIPELIEEISQDDPAITAPRRGPQSEQGTPMNLTKNYDDDYSHGDEPDDRADEAPDEKAVNEDASSSSVNILAESKNYTASEQDGLVTIESNDSGDSYYFDSWSEAGEFLSKAPTSKGNPKHLTKQYDDEYYDDYDSSYDDEYYDDEYYDDTYAYDTEPTSGGDGDDVYYPNTVPETLASGGGSTSPSSQPPKPPPPPPPKPSSSPKSTSSGSKSSSSPDYQYENIMSPFYAGGPPEEPTEYAPGQSPEEIYYEEQRQLRKVEEEQQRLRLKAEQDAERKRQENKQQVERNRAEYQRSQEVRQARKERLEAEANAKRFGDLKSEVDETRSMGRELGWTVSLDGKTVQSAGQSPLTLTNPEHARQYMLGQLALERKQRENRRMRGEKDRPVSVQKGADFSSEPIQKAYDGTTNTEQYVGPNEFEQTMTSVEPDTMELDQPAELDSILLYENPIQPPAVPPDDPDYKKAESEAKTSIESRLIDIGGTLRGMVPGFSIEFPEGFDPPESPSFTSWQQAAEWLGIELQDQPVPIQEALTYDEYRMRKGSEDSGNFGHAGRPGQVGGSAPRSGKQTSGTVASKRSQSGETPERSGLSRPRGAKREDDGKPLKELLPNWYGGIYGGLMRQYILGRPRQPVDYPKYNDLTEEQQSLIEKMVENHDVLVYTGAEATNVLPDVVVDNVLRPAAEKTAEAIDFMTYDKDGRKIQDYVNFATYILGIKARGKFKEKLQDSEFIERQTARQWVYDSKQNEYVHRKTGEVINNPVLATKEMPRWLFPKTEAGRFSSYVFNPFSLVANVASSLFMAYALPNFAEQLKRYAKGDARAFNPLLGRYLKREKVEDDNDEQIRESEHPEHIQAINALVDTLHPESGPVPQIIGPLLTDAIFDAMENLSDDEIGMVIPLMAYLGEENIKALVDKGKTLPTDDEGQPMVSLKAQKVMGMSDEQRERLTPIAMLVATLSGIYTAWPTMSGALDKKQSE